jgi:large subunit ribosomal protein L21
MYAVIETGGKQYRVEVGTELEVELLDVEPGQTITLDRVLLVADGAEAAVGTPTVAGAAVDAHVVGATRGDKVIAFKYRPKARRRVKKGHRQELTVLRIADIRFGGKSAAETDAKAPSKADEKKRIQEAAARQAAEDTALAAKLNMVPAPEPVVAEPEAPAAPKRAKAAAVETVAPEPAAEPAPTAAEPKPDADEAKQSQSFEIYEDKAGQWRWRLRARNGEMIAMSEQGFTTKAGVVRALDVVRRNVAAAESHEEAGPANSSTPEASTSEAAPKRTRTKKDE